MWCIYTLLSQKKKKEGNFAILMWTWVDLRGQYAKWNKSYRETEILNGINYMWNLKKKKKTREKKKKRKKQTYRYREQTSR